MQGLRQCQIPEAYPSGLQQCVWPNQTPTPTPHRTEEEQLKSRLFKEDFQVQEQVRQERANVEEISTAPAHQDQTICGPQLALSKVQRGAKDFNEESKKSEDEEFLVEKAFQHSKALQTEKHQWTEEEVR